MHRKNNSC